MDEGEGIESIMEIRKINPTVHIIAMSGNLKYLKTIILLNSGHISMIAVQAKKIIRLQEYGLMQILQLLM